jgi:uncharacterized membrane protein (UPF0136 family)
MNTILIILAIYLISVVLASNFLRRFDFYNFVPDILQDFKYTKEVIKIIEILHFVPIINTIIGLIFTYFIFKRLWQKRK